MKAEKSDELIDLFEHSAHYGGDEILCFKPQLDTRDGEGKIFSYNGNRSIDATVVDEKRPEEILRILLKPENKHFNAIIIDEVQFFSDSVVHVIYTLKSMGYWVIVAGLYFDHQGDILGSLTKIKHFADEVNDKYAFCECPHPSHHTEGRKTCGAFKGIYTALRPDATNEEGKIIQVGRAPYMAMCRCCFHTHYECRYVSPEKLAIQEACRQILNERGEPIVARG
jgi:thymidine kinase